MIGVDWLFPRSSYLLLLIIKHHFVKNTPKINLFNFNAKHMQSVVTVMSHTKHFSTGYTLLVIPHLNWRINVTLCFKQRQVLCCSFYCWLLIMSINISSEKKISVDPYFFISRAMVCCIILNKDIHSLETFKYIQLFFHKKKYIKHRSKH